MHPLDNPVWTALSTRQSHFASGSRLAMRFPVDVSPFVAARDTSPGAISALAALVQENDEVSLLERAPPDVLPGISAVSKRCVQMTARTFPSGGQTQAITPLGEADAKEMFALATLTRPGPFRARTHTMGRFLGIRDGARLVAMGGERLSLDGFTEISALCTHPDHRGRGYGEALLCALGKRIISEGITPFLHSYADNAAAIALYRRVGFEVRTEVTHAVWKRPQCAAKV